jgi:hypothetical protein
MLKLFAKTECHSCECVNEHRTRRLWMLEPVAVALVLTSDTADLRGPFSSHHHSLHHVFCVHKFWWLACLGTPSILAALWRCPTWHSQISLLKPQGGCLRAHLASLCVRKVVESLLHSCLHYYTLLQLSSIQVDGGYIAWEGGITSVAFWHFSP